MNKLLMKIFGSLAALTLVAIGMSSPASAIVVKTCYVGFPSKLSIDPNNGLSSYIPWSQVTFSGDCPSNTIPATAYDDSYQYTSNGVDVNWTAAQVALYSGAVRFLYPGGGDIDLYVSTQITGQDALGNDTLGIFASLSGCPLILCGSFQQNSMTPMATILQTYSGDNVADLTELETYKFIPTNIIQTKYLTSLSVKTKRVSGSSFFTVKVNLNRNIDVLAVGQNITLGDRVTIKRGSRVIAKVTPNLRGYAKVRIRDIAGKNKYTVSVPATSYNWSAKKTFVK